MNLNTSRIVIKYNDGNDDVGDDDDDGDVIDM